MSEPAPVTFRFSVSWLRYVACLVAAGLMIFDIAQGHPFHALTEWGFVALVVALMVP